MEKTRLQVQVDSDIMDKVKKIIEDTGLHTLTVQDLVQILLAKVAREGVNIDVEFLKKN